MKPQINTFTKKSFTFLGKDKIMLTCFCAFHVLSFFLLVLVLLVLVFISILACVCSEPKKCGVQQILENEC